jgi:uncharacterized phage protein (TIGR01671 family)
MMKEHIYRAWHREEKDMYWFDVTWGNYEQGNGWIGMIPIAEEVITYTPSNRRQISPESVELMAYTGKVDKNGRRIFEGDILSYSNSKYSSGGLYLVEWSADECSFICERQKPFNYLSPCLWLECEIVGNICESSKLLGDGGIK